MSRTRTNKKTWVWTAMLLAVPLLASAQLAQPEAWTAEKIQDTLTLIANFLIAVGIIGAVITLVTAGIIYFASGFSTNAVAKAKGLFRGALIGTLLIVGAGVIINTIGVIITGEFFGVVGPGGTSLKKAGEPCDGHDECQTGACLPAGGGTNVCTEPKGEGAPCRSILECKAGLQCILGKEGYQKCTKQTPTPTPFKI